MKAVFAFDSFKGSASSGKLGEAALLAFLEILPHAETMCYQIADGGEGCLEALLSSPRGATAVQCKTHDPLMRRIVSSYATMPDGTAMIEAASASGLTLITESERNPMKTSSFGTGEQIADAIRSGCREIYLMLGGTATNDAGTGILSALGFIFRDADGNAVEPAGENLARIRHIDSSGALPGLDKCNFTLGCDVNTLFYGEQGAAYVFAAQKGASQKDIAALDEGLRNYAEAVLKATGKDISCLPGSGAAGGICGGLVPFLNAGVRSGIDIMMDITGLRNAIAEADIVFTGEGRIDGQTLMGKAVSGICRAADTGTKVIALCGSYSMTGKERDELDRLGCTAVFPIQPRPVTLEEAMKTGNVLANVARTVKEIARIYKTGLRSAMRR